MNQGVILQQLINIDQGIDIKSNTLYRLFILPLSLFKVIV